MPTGFKSNIPLTDEHSRASSTVSDNKGSQTKLVGDSGEDCTDPWIVSEREKVPEELHSLLVKVRHGYGI